MYRTEREEHQHSIGNMEGRTFTLMNVRKETSTGTYVEEHQPYEHVTDVDALKGQNTDELKLAPIRRDVPGRGSSAVLLMAEEPGRRIEGTVEHVPGGNGTPDKTIVRFKEERVILEEVLFDGFKDWLSSLSLLWACGVRGNQKYK